MGLGKKGIIPIFQFATEEQKSYIFLINKKIHLVLNIFIVIALLTSPVFAQRALTKGGKDESVKSDKVSLNGSVFAVMNTTDQAITGLWL
jgi:hypothetical protein